MRLSTVFAIVTLFFLFGFNSSSNLLAQSATAEQETASSSTQEEFTARVRVIASNSTSESRLSSLVTILDELEVKYDVEEFEAGRKTGKNLIIEIPHPTNADAETIAIGAHYDQFQVGQGAVDNACSCAALIEMIQQFQETPLENHALQILFFDLEEIGLLGSKAFVKARDEETLPKHFINVDIFGYGDTIWLMSNADNSLQKAFEAAGTAASIPVKSSPMDKYPPSDHQPFVAAEVPTVSVALIDGEEIEAIKSLLSGQRVSPPRILRTIHTNDDTTEAVEPEQSAKAIPLLESAIRILDAGN